MAVVLTADKSNRPPSGGFPEEELYVSNLVLAVGVCLLAGMGLGTVNLLRLLRGDWAAAWIQIHGHLQLLGWVGLFIMGIGSHAIPRFAGVPLKRPRLLTWATWSLFSGLLLRIPGQLWTAGRILWVLSAVLEWVGMSIFVLVMGELVWRARHRGAYLAVVGSSLAWGWLATVGTVLLTAQAVRSGSPVLSAAGNEAVVMILLLGFAGLMICAFATRTLPRFLGLSPAPETTTRLACWLLDAGVVGIAAGELSSTWLRGVGAVLWLTGSVVVVQSIGLLRRPVKPLEAGDQSFRRFLLASFGWLLLGGVLQAWAAFDGMQSIFAYSAMRHAFALGFVTTTIYAFSLRILPVFTASGEAPRSLVWALFWSQWVGTLLRVAHGLLANAGQQVAGFAEMGAAFNVLAFALFAGVVLTLLRARERAGIDIPVTYPIHKDMKVGPIVTCFPIALPFLMEQGFTMLANPALRERVASRVSLRQACRILNLSPDTVVEGLNSVLQQARLKTPACAVSIDTATASD